MGDLWKISSPSSGNDGHSLALLARLTSLHESQGARTIGRWKRAHSTHLMIYAGRGGGTSKPSGEC